MKLDTRVLRAKLVPLAQQATRVPQATQDPLVKRVLQDTRVPLATRALQEKQVPQVKQAPQVLLDTQERQERRDQRAFPIAT